MSQNINGQTPFEVAVRGGYNDFAVLMGKSMDPVKYVALVYLTLVSLSFCNSVYVSRFSYRGGGIPLSHVGPPKSEILVLKTYLIFVA